MQTELKSWRLIVALSVGLVLPVALLVCTCSEVRAQTVPPSLPKVTTAAVLGVQSRHNLAPAAPCAGCDAAPGGLVQVNTDSASGISGVVTVSGRPAQKITLTLRQYDDIVETTVMTTTTDAIGHYLFADVPSLPPGQKYYVRFGPNELSTYVYIWFGPPLNAYVSGEAAAGGDFDIANIDLPMAAWVNVISPLPGTFAWTKRSAPDDSYRLRLQERAGRIDVSSPLLGYVDNYTLVALPAGVQFDRDYYWYIEAVAPGRGFGYSFYMGSVRFSADTLAHILAHVLETESFFLENSFEWVTSGDLPWFGETSVTHDGVDAAQSGTATTEGQVSWLETNVVGPGMLSFYWRGPDRYCNRCIIEHAGLYFYVDGVQRLICDGSAWSFATYALPAGAHTIRWQVGPVGNIGNGFSQFSNVDQVAYSVGPTVGNHIYLPRVGQYP